MSLTNVVASLKPINCGIATCCFLETRPRETMMPRIHILPRRGTSVKWPAQGRISLPYSRPLLVWRWQTPHKEDTHFSKVQSSSRWSCCSSLQYKNAASVWPWGRGGGIEGIPSTCSTPRHGIRGTSASLKHHSSQHNLCQNSTIYVHAPNVLGSMSFERGGHHFRHANQRRHRQFSIIKVSAMTLPVGVNRPPRDPSFRFASRHHVFKSIAFPLFRRRKVSCCEFPSFTHPQ